MRYLMSVILVDCNQFEKLHLVCDTANLSFLESAVGIQVTKARRDYFPWGESISQIIITYGRHLSFETSLFFKIFYSLSTVFHSFKH